MTMVSTDPQEYYCNQLGNLALIGLIHQLVYRFNSFAPPN